MQPRRTRHGVSALLVAVGLCLAAPALGQPPQPSAAAKSTARTLLVDGRAKYASGDYPGALKAFQGAHAIMGVPTTGLDLARTQAQLGQLTEAREMAAEVMRFDSAGNQAFVNAQQEAAALAQELDARIPSVVLNVSGVPAGAALEVTMDGERVPPAVLSLPRKVNPGEHTVLAKASGFADAQRTVNVGEKETKYIDITLARVGSASADVVEPYGSADTGGGGGVPTWAWVVGGVGVASAAASVGFGIHFANVRGDIDERCPNQTCPPNTDTAALLASWNRSLALTVVFATVGAAGLGAATYGIVTAKPKAQASAMVTPWIGPGGGGVLAVGRF
ncbi:PEGA domain-containing protein [Polyangium aurulentum]|uniref:PEGA domain-containing protein n=1 Tax=Polyangium aurulentum TaxID=2567896 RepID=UPI0010AE8F44|nr:PEGA domain-containing protein [Polyangium aurulentum]UQA57650.1 PEGA domain-containing protein [Polyangium aurulentum]